MCDQCSVFNPVCWRQGESNPGVECRRQAWLVREVLAFRPYARGLSSLVMTIDLRRAFPSTVREYALLAMFDSFFAVTGVDGDAWIETLWHL